MNTDLSKQLSLPIGTESFDEIRKDNYYYVDKTGFLPELLLGGDKVTLLTRPRRFGKTLTLKTLQSFFDIQKDSKELFKGLKIMDYPDVCAQWMNQYPTVFITLKDVGGSSFEDAYKALQTTISDTCKKHIYLSKSDAVDRNDLDIFNRLYEKKADKDELKSSLKILSDMLMAHHGKPVIILIDEYDVPLDKADVNGYYKEMIDIIRDLLCRALKTNDSLKRAFLTGCLRVSKESIFTGFNNPRVLSISDEELSEFIGFTQAEVDQLLADVNLNQCGQSLKEWYDGYIFGTSEMYCPWDVLNHVKKLQKNPMTPPQGYWKNSSSNDVLSRFFKKGISGNAKSKFEALLAGESVQVSISETMTYGNLADNEDNFWSLLYLTGYLTKADKTLSDGANINLRIPNAEIMELFKSTIVDRFKQGVRDNLYSKLFDAFWNGDANTVNEELGKLLRSAISYHDNKEDYYHALIFGMFTAIGEDAKSNRESGDGRPDIIVQNDEKQSALVIEIKHSKEESRLEADCNKALTQIVDRRYATGFPSYIKTIHSYGMAFYKKSCLVKKVE